MKKLYSILLFVTAFTNAQTFQWADFPTITSVLNSSFIGYTITCDNQGNVYDIGFKDNYFYSSDVYGNMFYRKYALTGELLFEKTIIGKVRVFNAIADTEGNVYLSLSFKNSISFGLITIEGSTSEQPILLKLNSSGNFLWNKIINFPNSNTNFTALTIDSESNVYIGYSNFFDSSIKKFDSSGNEQLTIFQENVKVLSSISVDELGNIYAAGSCCQSNSRFADVLQPTSLDYSNYAVKYSPTGEHQWTRYIEDITCADPQISVKKPENIYLSSPLSGSFAFGTLTAQGPSSGFSDDIFITKLNADGNFEWIKEVPGTGKASIGNRNFLTSDASGNVYFAGSTKGTTLWSDTISTVVSGFNRDALVLKYNSSGDLLFAKNAGGTSDDRCDGIAIDDIGNIYISGMASGNVDFDGIINNNSNNYPFVAKIATTLSNTDFDSVNLYIYPNPAQKEITILNLNQKADAIIYNALGQKVKILAINFDGKINIDALSKGAYFLKTANKKVLKFIKN